MLNPQNNILVIRSLKIGYQAGRNTRILLPPLNAGAGKGELIAVIGKNGIGKSTLLRTIAGLQGALSGEIFYEGKDIRDYSRTDLAQTVGYISTEIVKVSSMRVYDLVALGRFPYTNWLGKTETADHEIIMDAIEKTGLSVLRDRFISELSDGERQKAMIARILAQDTGVMIMDEPTAFLDIGSKFEILHLMHRLSQKSGKTIIFSTHDLNVALSQADKIWLVLPDGIEEGAPEDLMLSGSLDNLFDSSAVIFNPDNGTYSFMPEKKGEIFVEGSGVMLHYSKKALVRAGFSVIEGSDQPCLAVPSGDCTYWQFRDTGAVRSFCSLYEFIAWLSSEWSVDKM
jgi:iron complex transport system ATP-binding protein